MASHGRDHQKRIGALTAAVEIELHRVLGKMIENDIEYRFPVGVIRESGFADISGGVLIETVLSRFLAHCRAHDFDAPDPTNNEKALGSPSPSTLAHETRDAMKSIARQGFR